MRTKKDCKNTSALQCQRLMAATEKPGEGKGNHGKSFGPVNTFWTSSFQNHERIKCLPFQPLSLL